MLKTLSAFAVGAMLSCGAAGANNLGFLRVDSAITLDASTPLFYFTTLDILSGASVQFTGLKAGDTLSLIASDAIRIGGALSYEPASSVRLEALRIEIGQGVVFDLPGGSITLVAHETGSSSAGSGLPRGSASLVSSAGGDLNLRASNSVPAGSISSGGYHIAPQGSITLQAPVPEPETWPMLLAGLGLVGFMVRRRSKG